MVTKSRGVLIKFGAHVERVDGSNGCGNGAPKSLKLKDGKIITRVTNTRGGKNSIIISKHVPQNIHVIFPCVVLNLPVVQVAHIANGRVSTPKK